MTFEELKEKAHGLPLKPGVYIMQDAKNEVIYVGKAKALKNRVSQYFADLASHTEKTRAMVSQIDHFDVIIPDQAASAQIQHTAQGRQRLSLYPSHRAGSISPLFPGQ